MIINNITEIIKCPHIGFDWFHAFKNKFEIGLLLLIGDWLEETQDDLLFAQAWREMYKMNVFPCHVKEYDDMWVADDWTEVTLAFDHFKYYGITSYKLSFHNAIIPRDIFDLMMLLKHYRVDYSLSHPYQLSKYYQTSSVGKGWAYTRLAYGIALKLYGYKPEFTY